MVGSTGHGEVSFSEIVNDVRKFADAEGLASGLPGAHGGPRDAYRHMIAAAELRRRAGDNAYWPLEWNEIRSWGFDFRDWATSQPRHPADTPKARLMDRRNNRLGLETGAFAKTPEEIVQWARGQIERAATWGGAGHNDTAAWLPQRDWVDRRDPSAPASIWPRIEWKDLAAADHLRAYPGRNAPAAYPNARWPEDGAQCPASVRAHIRGGHPVRGYLRSCAASD